MFKLLLISCLFIGFTSAQDPWREIDLLIRNGLDIACQALEKIIIVTPPQKTDLQIVEYTTLGFRNHSFYPSAAQSVINSKFFNPNKPTVIFAHGYTSNPFAKPAMTIAEAYRKHGGYNILTMDSSKLIPSRYLRSIKMTKYIGDSYGRFLVDLVKLGVAAENLHLVGHSLGAHITGAAAKTFNQLMPNQKLPRITGLDPAGPCFHNVGPDRRLDASDAVFVDVIHSNDGVYGLNNSIGYIDFYPNGGGANQPGCSMNPSCSHARAFEFYAESVNNPQNFLSVQCGSWGEFLDGYCVDNQQAVMGMDASRNLRGRFYLATKRFSPYGMGAEGIVPK